MQILTFCSFKGGTSKTSTALNLGACLAKNHGKRVLLIDFDAQANLSIGLGIGPDSLKTMAAVLQGEGTIKEMIQETKVKGLHLIAANAYLDGIERSPQLGNDPYAHERLRRAVKDVEKDFDFCFLDTPPSLGWLTQSAFFASHGTIVCAIPEAFSVLALRRLRDFHASINQYHAIEVVGLVLSFWDERGAVNKDFLEEIERSFPEKLFSRKIRRDVSVSRSVLCGKPVIEVDPTSRASQDYIALSGEFIEKVGRVACLKR